MNLKTLLASILLVSLSACNDTEDEPSIQPPVNNPSDVVLTINNSNLEITIGQSVNIDYSVTPAETKITWTSSDTRIATVNEDGCVTGVARGSVTITATAGQTKASLNVKVERATQVGDYYYSDGTVSNVVISNKDILGVIFWLGDPTTDDAALRRDHPDCTHGLVVAAYPDMSPTPWQSNAYAYGLTTGDWIENNIADQYVSTVSIWTKDTRRNYIAGYNNTKALELFNAATENAMWPLEAIQRVADYRASYPAPSSSSDWFLPGLKELTLLINSEHDGDVFDFNNIAKDKAVINKQIINESLAKINGSQPIGSKEWAYDYWSSADWDPEQAYHVSTFNGTVMLSPKTGDNNQLIRCVLAF